MITINRIRRRIAGAGGSPTDIVHGELAFNEVDGILYYGSGAKQGSDKASLALKVGGAGNFVALEGNQTISGIKTFSGTVSLGSSASATTPASNSNDTTVATTAFVTTKTSGLGTGTVTSVGLSLPNIFTVSASPVTLSGNLTASLASQTTNTVFAAPNGSTGAPTFRSLVTADIPTLTAAKVSDFDTQVRTSRLDQMAAPIASVALNSQKITGLADPTTAQDAATKFYVDNSRLGIDFKDSVRAATTANIATLAGGAPSTLDGVSLAANDRILVKNQTTTSQNGIYKVDTVGTGSNGSWSRTTDADGTTFGELTSGAFVYVEQGTANAQDQYVITTTGTITVDTTGITWGLFSGAGKITAGSGLSKNKDTLLVSLGTSSGLETTSGLVLSNTGVSAGSYQSVTVDVKGRVTAGTNPTTLSGYGITDAQASDPTLTALAGVTTAADQIIYATGSDTFLMTDLTSTARTLLDDTSTSAMRTTLGVAIGTDVQAYNAALASIADLITVADRMIYTTAANTYAVTTITSFGRSLVDDADAFTARTTLGLGTISTQNANSVLITGGSIDNITIDGGTY